MRTRDLALFGAAMLAGAIGGSLIGPRTAEAVAREIIELQQSVTQVLQGQKDLATANTQDHAVLKTLLEQSTENVTKLSSTMGTLQKSFQDVQANSGARLDTMSTQVQGLSDNLEEIKSRLGKLNQQLVDLQNAVQSIDAKLASSASATSAGAASQALLRRGQRVQPLLDQLNRLLHPPPTRFTTTVFATSRVANMIWLVRSFRTT